MFLVIVLLKLDKKRKKIIKERNHKERNNNERNQEDLISSIE